MAKYANRDHDEPNGRPSVPLVPRWARRWAGAFLLLAAITIIAVLQVGIVYGATKGLGTAGRVSCDHSHSLVARLHLSPGEG